MRWAQISGVARRSPRPLARPVEDVHLHAVVLKRPRAGEPDDARPDDDDLLDGHGWLISCVSAPLRMIQASWAGSTLPPDRIAPTRRPMTRPASTAATPTAPLGSVTVFAVRARVVTAVTISASVTSTTSSTSLVIIW